MPFKNPDYSNKQLLSGSYMGEGANKGMKHNSLCCRQPRAGSTTSMFVILTFAGIFIANSLSVRPAMGGGYSDLNVLFHAKNTDKYSENGYNITVKKENFPGCSNFVVFTHTITFTKEEDKLNYNVLLYDGNTINKGNRVFGYYYPRDINQVVEELKIYYFVLEPNVPLVVSFKCPGNIYNCYFGKLKEAGWDRAYNITSYSFGKECDKSHLLAELRTMTRNKKIGFTIGTDNVDIFGIRQEIKDKNFRFIFIPKGKKSLQGNQLLFAIDFDKQVPKLSDTSDDIKSHCSGILNHVCKNSSKKENCMSQTKTQYSIQYNFEFKHKNAIDPYYLNSVNGHFFDGIMVYFVRTSDRPPQSSCENEEDNKCMALLVEFVDSCNSKIHIKRKDKEGYWWSKEKVDYKDDDTLLKKLKEIKEQAQNEVNTVILDKKERYLGVESVDPKDIVVYKQYTYKFKGAKNPNIIYDRKDPGISAIQSSTIKSQNVEVYFLKAGGKEDKKPFLIVLDQNGQPENKKKAYYFKHKASFKEWKEFTDFNKLQDKLDKISKYGKCIHNLSLLQWYAYEILTGKDPPPQKPKEEKTPNRPDTFKPPPKEKTLPIPLIAGCSTAGGVFVISSAAGYGIYWYNTTIKLLT
ncbi:hypothetical protein TOT_010000657 [Theileria orientalis strain Shintoku]|uniref:Uncharacterized protein n=1 Tax=Theileria orientalis strain Shintoku TaxID=869250 RepID=J4CCD4_THEOR|nr:hypothetical protein TOT_010000657 [Theileria orientalis strain Shintoku]BAM39197.1 hypothetical protein TOT_010000657 [Theileria orientalis strain Shintoku]|eukprot:XP_009689498.1 hypothetical protein TOT_010000657 [Theileria orientalis strain Shintoku]